MPLSYLQPERQRRRHPPRPADSLEQPRARGDPAGVADAAAIGLCKRPELLRRRLGPASASASVSPPRLEGRAREPPDLGEGAEPHGRGARREPRGPQRPPEVEVRLQRQAAAAPAGPADGRGRGQRRRGQGRVRRGPPAAAGEEEGAGLLDGEGEGRDGAALLRARGRGGRGRGIGGGKGRRGRRGTDGSLAVAAGALSALLSLLLLLASSSRQLQPQALPRQGQPLVHQHDVGDDAGEEGPRAEAERERRGGGRQRGAEEV